MFGQIMMRVRVISIVPEPAALLWWLALVVVVSLLASAWPAFRATRITTSAALAYE
jgi:putative ABC transport system permease protein